jgi:hypothetical protein
VGDSTVAIHWDYAREVLQKADGVLATVGLEADLSAPPAPDPIAVSGPPGGPAATPTAAATGGPAVAPGAGSQSAAGSAAAAGNIDK